MLSELAGIHIVLAEELLAGGVDRRRAHEELPHPRTGFVKTKIPLRLEIQKDRFLVQKADEDMRRHTHAIRKAHHQRHSPILRSLCEIWKPIAS